MSNTENTAITIEAIEAAERLVGVNYTREERELMLDNLDSQIEGARARRAMTLENHVPTASRFDPRLAGFRPPPPQAPIRGSDGDPGPLPDSDEDIAFAPVTSLSQWIARGDLGSRRLTEIYLGRIESLAGTLACFVTITPELDYLTRSTRNSEARTRPHGHPRFRHGNRPRTSTRTLKHPQEHRVGDPLANGCNDVRAVRFS